METKYTTLVSKVDIMTTTPTAPKLNQELRQNILSLPGVTERQNAGIHEDAFFIDGTMFMHIHGSGHCDIRLAKTDQERVLAEGKAQAHRWAPQKGYVTFIARQERDLEPAMELIRMSYRHFSGQKPK
jgi:luciferase-like monooxygenase